MNNDDHEQRVQSLMSIHNLRGIDNQAALQIIGELDDLSAGFQLEDGLEKANKLADELGKRKLSPRDFSFYHYCRANIWADIRYMKTQNNIGAWAWEQAEIDNEIIHLRSALQKGFDKLDSRNQCNVLTNLGNLLSNIGRFVEAVEFWNRALSIDPEFGMALGNRGKGYFHYANALYDPGHRAVFLKHAYYDLQEALKLPLYEDARAGFSQLLMSIEKMFRKDALKDRNPLPEYSTGDSDEEIEYRQWCLENKLFLNPLNDLGAHSIAAKDILHTPNITVKTGADPHYQRFANQIKQEYATARFLLFRGISDDSLHYSDKDVYLFDTFDNACLSASVEMVKASYQIVYSLFDRIALFMNYYLALKIRPGDVSFRTFWYQERKRNNGLRDEFKSYINWPFRGLFWLSKDLFEGKKGFRQTLEPDALDISKIRNFLEHKYFHLHSDITRGDFADKELRGFSYSLNIREFQKKALKLMKLSRAAITYLLLGIHFEEKQRIKKSGTVKKLTIELPLLRGDDNARAVDDM